MQDLKQSYKTIMDDNFPDNMKISFGGNEITFRKRTWKIEENGTLVEKGLRYGENPGQEAALYEPVNGNITLGNCKFITPGNSLVSGLSEQDLIQFGKHPGKTNLTDIDNSLNILKYLSDSPAVVIVKHNNPCGVAKADSLADAAEKAYFADRIAAFGGCISLNKTVDTETAKFISEQYFEVVAAPDYADGTIDILKKRKNLRIVKISDISNLEKYKNLRFLDFKSLMDGGLVVQQSPLNIINSISDFKPAASEYKGQNYAVKRLPTDKEYEDLLFGWFVEQGVTSNSVLFVKNGVTVGIGTGEQDRVGVAEIAVNKAYSKFADALCFKKFGIPLPVLKMEVKNGKEDSTKLETIMDETNSVNAGLKGSAMVSDAFFPFRDGADVGIEQGITSIVQPGGSIRDFETIEACNEVDPIVAMVFTGQRAFKH